MGRAAERALVLAAGELAEARVMPVGGGQAFVFTARCPGRQGPSEDAAAVFPVGPSRGLLVVADGMGGRPGGAEAAARVVEAIRTRLANGNGQTSLRSLVLEALDEANRAVAELGGGAATTVAIAELEDGEVRTYHVGDSAVLVTGQRGRIKLQTVAHSPVGYAIESGLLDERAALEHAERHVVSNVVGNPDMRVEMSSPLKLAPRDSVLVATDGLLDNMRREEIVDVIRRGPLEQAGRRLAELSLQRMSAPRAGDPSKPDDLSFIVYRPGL